MDNYYTYNPGPYETGIAPPSQLATSRPVSEKEKVDLWFCDQLEAMKGDDAFICLMIAFPLLEVMIRHDLKIADDQDVVLSDNSPALHWFSKFLSIPDSQARMIWDAFRNGLVHRAMIKGSVPYVLTGEMPGRLAKFENEMITIYVWELRNAVVSKLRIHHRRLWAGSSSPLPGIYERG
jgi:hypothetical protein